MRGEGGGLLGLLQIGAGQVLAQRLVGDGEDHQRDGNIGQHVGQIVQKGVEPGAVHGHAEEGVGHVGGPDGGAHHIVYQEACAAGYQCAQKDTVLTAGKQAGQAQHREGQQIVTDDGLPADGEASVKHELQDAEQEAVQQTGAQSPADGVQHQRHHGQNDTAAPRHLPQLDIAEDLGYGQQYGALAQGADFCVIHN